VSIRSLIEGLTGSGVQFVIVGMVAGQLYGSRYNTEDLDIVYERSQGNVDRLCRYLLSVGAYVKEAWPNEGLAQSFACDDLVTEGSLTLGTTEGELDVLHRIDGVGDFASVLAASRILRLPDGGEARVLSLPALIASKVACGREKDKLHIPELEAILEVRQHSGSDDA
jgi:hypothetical protein